MSWQDYISGYLQNYTDQNTGKSASNVSEHAAIIGNTDGTIWAATPGFSLSTYQTEVAKEDGSGTDKVDINEFTNLLDAFNNDGRSTKKGGIHINKEKYFTVNFDKDVGIMYLKKNGGGAAVAKTNLGFVIATFNSKNKCKNLNGSEEPQNPGLVNKAVIDLQKFLLDNNL